MTDSPAALGFRWPAEWESHLATWLAWPHNEETWPGKFGKIPACFTQFVRAVADHEPVRLLAAAGPVGDSAAAHLAGAENIDWFDLETNDAWIRDYGPMFLRRDSDGQTAMVDWNYNAWGAKHPPFELDNSVPKKIAECLATPRFVGPLTLEGGAVESNGQGDLLTTRSCLPSASRNKGRTTDGIESILRDHTGAERVHWLPRGELAGDDTDGHIDQLARFIAPQTIVAAVAETDDPHVQTLEENWRFLSDATGADGRSFDLVRLPIPKPISYRGRRLPASYCNFYLLNGAIIVPQFGDSRADQNAQSILRELLPERRVIALDAYDLLWGLGAFHCLSQPQWSPCLR